MGVDLRRAYYAIVWTDAHEWVSVEVRALTRQQARDAVQNTYPTFVVLSVERQPFRPV